MQNSALSGRVSKSRGDALPSPHELEHRLGKKPYGYCELKVSYLCIEYPLQEIINHYDERQWARRAALRVGKKTLKGYVESSARGLLEREVAVGTDVFT
jgi:hypothetical protein